MSWKVVAPVGIVALVGGVLGTSALTESESAAPVSGTTATQSVRGLELVAKPNVAAGFSGTIAVTPRGNGTGNVNVHVSVKTKNRRLTLVLYTKSKSKQKLLMALTPGQVEQRTWISIKQLARYDRVGLYGYKDPRKGRKGPADVRVLASVSVKELLATVVKDDQF